MAYRTYRTGIDFGFGYGLTPAVKNLIIANVAAFVLTILADRLGFGGLIGWLMLIPYEVTHQLFVWQLVSYMFLHAGFFHILFNMFALWMFGCELERTWGTRRFLWYYFLTGIGSALTVIVVSPSSTVATLGASGAIYGILLAYGVLFADRLIFLYFLIPIKAKYFVMIMGGIEFLSAISTPGSLVSHVAHLGGMIFGILYLRGRPIYFDLRNRYYHWRRLRLQRSFEVYRRKREREEQRRDPWVH
jgi:membrane associated rhomboid family serine protease